MLGDRPRNTGDIVEDKVKAFPAVIDIVHVLAFAELAFVGEVLCCELNLVYHASVVVGSGGSTLIAGCRH